MAHRSKDEPNKKSSNSSRKNKAAGWGYLGERATVLRNKFAVRAITGGGAGFHCVGAFVQRVLYDVVEKKMGFRCSAWCYSRRASSDHRLCCE